MNSREDGCLPNPKQTEHRFINIQRKKKLSECPLYIMTNHCPSRGRDGVSTLEIFRDYVENEKILLENVYILSIIYPTLQQIFLNKHITFILPNYWNVKGEILNSGNLSTVKMLRCIGSEFSLCKRASLHVA